MSVRIELNDISVSLGGTQAVDDLSLTAEPGEFLTLLGPSGSGKTTTLNVIAGFVNQTRGSVCFDGERMDSIPPQERGIGIVFQSYALFPHMNVEENVTFPLRARRIRGPERKRRVSEALELVQLGTFRDRSIRSLSGGQQQRVALARALVFAPRLLLLDEPLSALDKRLRETMQVEVKRIQRDVGVTTVAVTHDQTEAFAMSDRVGVLSNGRLEQLGTPNELYVHPANEFVARFLGDANLVTVQADGRLGPFETRLPGAAPGTVVMIRPELVTVTTEPPPEAHPPVTVESVVYLGANMRMRAQTDGYTVVASLPAGQPPIPYDGQKVWLSCDIDRVHVLSGSGDSPPVPAVGVAPGSRSDIASPVLHQPTDR